MVARGPGAVGCAHCTTIGAEHPCPICKRLVCPKCASDWVTCSELSGRIVRLGLTARVRDVDPLGRLALISHWRQPLRVLDLRQLRWKRDVALPRKLYLTARPYPPRLTSDGCLIHSDIHIMADLAMGATGGVDIFMGGFKTIDLATGETKWLVEPQPDAPFFGTAVSSANDAFMFINSAQKVVLVLAEAPQALPTGASSIALGLDGRMAPSTVRMHVLDPLPRKVIQAAAFDAERALLASASWSEVAVHELNGERLQRTGYCKPHASGDVKWVAIAGSHVAFAVHDLAQGTQVEVRELNPDRSVGRNVSFSPFQRDFRCAALSRDGRYLATAFGKTLAVHEVGTDRNVDFKEHTDEINYVRFAADHVLISADTDNRVILRPRTPRGYDVPLMPVDPS